MFSGSCTVCTMPIFPLTFVRLVHVTLANKIGEREGITRVSSRKIILRVKCFLYNEELNVNFFEKLK
jgi:hypothetical protein